MSSVAPKQFSLVPPTIHKFLAANFPPKTLQYFSILLLLRTLLGKVKIRRRTEDLAYITFLEPAVLTLMHCGGRSRWPFSTKYRIFLDRAVWPSGVSPRYEKLHDCTQFHPGTDACAGSMIRDAPITLNKLVSLYLRFYLIQFAVTYLIQSISFFLSESHLHWTHLLRNIRKRREKEAELAKIAEEAAKEMFGDESEEESGEESEEEEKPLRKIDSAVDVAALGQFKSMTGLRSTHRGRERFVRPVSPAPDTSVKPLSSTEHGKPEQDSLQVPQPRHASRSLSASKKRKMSIAPPPTTPLNLETLKSFIVRLVFDKFPNQLIRYLEAVFRSTAFLWTNEMVIRAGYCLLAEFDRRRRGVKVADISRYWPIIYLINVIGSIPMVVERHSRVTIINRMMITYLVGDMLPSSQAAAYSTMAVAMAAGVATKTLGFQTLFGAAWSAIEM